jgi:hypothetical protein
MLTRVPIKLTAVPVRVTQTGGQTLRLARNSLEFTELELVLRVLALEGGARLSISIEAAMQNESETGWVEIAQFSQHASAPATETLTVSGPLLYLRYNVTDLDGGTAATFSIQGIAKLCKLTQRAMVAREAEARRQQEEREAGAKEARAAAENKEGCGCEGGKGGGTGGCGCRATTWGRGTGRGDRATPAAPASAGHASTTPAPHRYAKGTTARVNRPPMITGVLQPSNEEYARLRADGKAYRPDDWELYPLQSPLGKAAKWLEEAFFPPPDLAASYSACQSVCQALPGNDCCRYGNWYFCINTLTNSDHCGSCDSSCKNGFKCVGGACKKLCDKSAACGPGSFCKKPGNYCDDSPCAQDTDCPGQPGLKCCDGLSCVDTFNPDQCGFCDQNYLADCNPFAGCISAGCCKFSDGQVPWPQRFTLGAPLLTPEGQANVVFCECMFSPVYTMLDYATYVSYEQCLPYL